MYFCVLEALQNVSKYAEASRVTVLLREREGAIDFHVMDEGRGFDMATTPLGMGLQSMADRMAAIGGSFDVKTKPGPGTNVVGRIPISWWAELVRRPRGLRRWDALVASDLAAETQV